MSPLWPNNAVGRLLTLCSAREETIAIRLTNDFFNRSRLIPPTVELSQLSSLSASCADDADDKWVLGHIAAARRSHRMRMRQDHRVGTTTAEIKYVRSTEYFGDVIPPVRRSVVC